MKLTYKHYAYLLLDVTRGVSEKKLIDVISRFSEILISFNASHLLPKIINFFVELYNKEAQIIAVNFTSAIQLDKAIISQTADFLKKKLGCKSVEVTERVNPDLIGGIKITYGDTVIDASIKNQIESLKKQIIS